MLESVDVGSAIADYEAIAGREVVERLRALAEILRSEVPLLRDLGLYAGWKVVTGDK